MGALKGAIEWALLFYHYVGSLTFRMLKSEKFNFHQKIKYSDSVQMITYQQSSEVNTSEEEALGAGRLHPEV